ncbi:MAG: hypothetical protein OQJ96_12405 [Flavobacteriales bacterium]|nr:hypothetical protein [Flavobacteriales bacterium]MCW8913889.1 hypothetical protein [Flavobacteriales bacterium]MCW8937261.1 hypothetical protein [Flavobacteriales bacterium]MCW8939422.1 hypothetical protein [Flavobacteriales bacterium]MCW8967223.1 hypothetical protein [Flavobacteriales bacterium]
MKIIILISIVLALVACSETTQNNNNTQEQQDTVANVVDTLITDGVKKQAEPTSFLQFYQQLVTAIETKNTAAFNQLFYKDYGLYIIESSGAMPQVSKVYEIENYQTSGTKLGFFDLPFDSLSLMPLKEKLPKVVCEKNSYDKQGCFQESINPLKDSQIWHYANLNEKEVQAIQFISETIKITVVNTYNYTFYFSQINGSWQLSFIDLRIPCTA